MDLQNKKYGLIVLLLSVLSLSCRKEINHLVGTTIVDNNANIEKPADWVKLTDKEMLEVYTMQVFNGELYIGGEFDYESDSITFLAKVSESGQVQRVVNASFNFFGIYDMEVIDNHLYMVGYFSFWDYGVITAQSILRINSDGEPESNSIFDVGYHTVEDIQAYNGDILIAGYFDSEDGGNIISKNVELLVDHVPTGMADLPSRVYQTVIHEDNIYALGGDDVLLQKWNGSGWSPTVYNEPSFLDEVFAGESYNNELYIFGNFDSNTLLKKMKADGTWENIGEVSSIGSVYSEGGFVIINDELYVYGDNLIIDGVQASNVIKLKGNNWVSVGQLSIGVNDLISFNEKIYAATNTGIYEIEQ